MSSRRERRNTPVEEIDKRKLSASSLKTALRIFSFIRPYRTLFIIGMCFLLISSFTTMTFPYLMGKLIDTSSEQTSTGLFASTNQLALVLVGLLVIQAVISFFRVYLFATVTEKAMADVRQVLYDKLVTLSIPFFFEERRVGELTSRSTNDVDQLQDMLSMTLPEFIRQVVTIVFGVGFIFFISAKLTLLMISTFPILIILAMVYGKFIRRLSKLRQDALADSNIVVEETMQNMTTVKAFANERYESARYKTFMQKVVDAGIRGAVNRGAFTTFLIFGLFGGFVLVLWYGAVLMKEGEVTAGTLTAFMLYTGFIGGAVGGIGDLYGRLQKTVGASERVFEILDTPGEVDLEPAATDEVRLSGSIRFRNIRFSYPTRKDIEVLKGISLHINSGEKIALAGASGAGKSTIAQLVLGFYQVDSGQIEIDGLPTTDYSLKHLRRNMAVVPQEVILFGGSIRENIGYGKPGSSDEEIYMAAKKAHALEFIEGFPEKLDTVVGERGVKLSGGQRQRIAIARAILKDPSILILDEATSSLDAESERLVQDALEVLMKDRTTIIIAHRLSTIRHADNIFVLEAGNIAEQGTFDELSKIDKGIFANLLKLQFLDKEKG